MRHTNLSSAVKRAKELAKKNGKSHYANGASGRYRVSDRKPEDSSFVQATPSGGEWSHKMNQATKTFTKSRIFGGVTMESIEREWEETSMKGLIEKLEGRDLSEAKYVAAKKPSDKQAKEFATRMSDVTGEANAIIRDFKQGKRIEAAQGIQDLLSSLQSAVFWGFGDFERQRSGKTVTMDGATDAIGKARKAVYKMERAISTGE